ncbi:MAG: hypothetical protein ACTHM0_00585 [Sphingomonas sp.]|jgi:hypothetical protein
MADPTRSPAAGGCLIAIAVMAGVVVGLFVHQPTIGFLGGLAVGIAAAVAVWLVDRR